MTSYFVSRFGYYVSLFFGIILFTFVLFHMVPSDPARTILGPNADQDQVEQLRAKLGLNRPLHRQFTQYLYQVATLDFGHSFVDERNVFHEVRKRVEVTLSLIAVSMVILFSYLLVVILSLLYARLKRCLDLLEFMLSSFPIFFSGIIVALFTINFYPVTHFSGNLGSWGDIVYIIPPALVLAFYPMAIIARIIKDEMTSILQSPYVTAEKAWGFSDFYILFRFALKNVLIPILSALSNILPMLLTGAFIIEIIFSIPGVGGILIKSILERDFPMLECTVIVNGAFFVIVNLGFEFLYTAVDPRIVKR